MDKKIKKIEKITPSPALKRVGIVSVNGRKYIYGKKDLEILNMDDNELREEVIEWLKNNK